MPIQAQCDPLVNQDLDQMMDQGMVPMMGVMNASQHIEGDVLF